MARAVLAILGAHLIYGPLILALRKRLTGEETSFWARENWDFTPEEPPPPEDASLEAPHYLER